MCVSPRRWDMSHLPGKDPVVRGRLPEPRRWTRGEGGPGRKDLHRAMNPRSIRTNTVLVLFICVTYMYPSLMSYPFPFLVPSGGRLNLRSWRLHLEYQVQKMPRDLGKIRFAHRLAPHRHGSITWR
ncbi:hypothetical protein FKM82_019897 [Ascaphus truei]